LNYQNSHNLSILSDVWHRDGPWTEPTQPEHILLTCSKKEPDLPLIRLLFDLTQRDFFYPKERLSKLKLKLKPKMADPTWPVPTWATKNWPNPTQVKKFWPGSDRAGRVSHLWFGFDFGKFPLKMSNFSIFSLRVGSKVPGSKAGRPLIYCRSEVCLGQGTSLDQLDTTGPFIRSKMLGIRDIIW